MIADADSSGDSTNDEPGRSRALAIAKVRGYVARIVWVVCLVIALVLAAAAFSYALEANQDNSLVKLVRDVADRCDLGWFDLNQPVWRATGDNAQTKTALANYGIAAVVYLMVGRLLERLIRA